MPCGLMRILNRQIVDEASKIHSEWNASLKSWWRIASEAKWRNFPDVRRTLGSADLVGTCLVFNIARKRARLIAQVDFKSELLVVLHVLSHADYDKDGWKNDCDCD